MIEFKQTLTEKDYSFAAEINYKRFRMSKIRVILAALLIVTGFVTLYLGVNRFYAVFCILYGIYMLLRKYLYVRNVVRSASSNANFGDEISISISDDGVFHSMQNNDEGKNDLKTFFGYFVHENGVLLFPQKNMWLFLKKENMGNEQYNGLLRQLEELQLKKF